MRVSLLLLVLALCLLGITAQDVTTPSDDTSASTATATATSTSTSTSTNATWVEPTSVATTTDQPATQAPMAPNSTEPATESPTSDASITTSPTTQQPTTSPTTEIPTTLSPTTDAPTQAPTTEIPTTAPTPSTPTQTPTPTQPTMPSTASCPSTRSIHDGTSKTAYRVPGPSLDDQRDFIISLSMTVIGQQIWQPLLIHQSDAMWGADRMYTQFIMYVQRQGINEARQLCVNMGHGTSSSSICSDNIIDLNTPYTITFTMTQSVGRLYVSQSMVGEMTLSQPWIASNQSQWAIGIYSEPSVGNTYFNGVMRDIMINSQCILPQLSSIVVFGSRFMDMIWRMDQYNQIQLTWNVRWNGTFVQYPVQALLPTVTTELMPRLNPPLIMTIPNTGTIKINLMNEFIARGQPQSWITSLFTQGTKIWFTITTPENPNIMGSTSIYTLQYPKPSYDNQNPSHMIRTAIRVSLILLSPMTTLVNQQFQIPFRQQLSTCLSMNTSNIIISSITSTIRPQSIHHTLSLSSNDEVTGLTVDLLYHNETRWDGTIQSKSMWLWQSLELNGMVADLTSQLSNTSSDIYHYEYTRLLSSSISSTPIIYCADMNNLHSDCLLPIWLIHDTTQPPTSSTTSSSKDSTPYWIIGVAVAGGLIVAIMMYSCIRSYRTRKASESPEMARFRAMTASSLQMEPSTSPTVADSHYAFVSRDPGVSISSSQYISRQVSLASWATRDTGMSISQRDIGHSVGQRDPALSISPLVGWMNGSGEYTTRSGENSASVSPRVYASIPSARDEPIPSQV